MATLFAAGGPDRVAGLAHGGGEPSAHWAARRAAGAALASAMRSGSLVLCTTLQRLPARHGPACDYDLGPPAIGLRHQRQKGLILRPRRRHFARELGGVRHA